MVIPSVKITSLNTVILKIYFQVIITTKILTIHLMMINMAEMQRPLFTIPNPQECMNLTTTMICIFEKRIKIKDSSPTIKEEVV